MLIGDGMRKTKLIFGVGVNDSDYQTRFRETVNGKRTTTWVCPFFTRWINMLLRCYNKAYLDRQPTYAGCTVDPRWHRFSVFKAWMERQDWQGKELDKDILVPGNKIYSPDTCVFVNRRLNRFLNMQCARRGPHPIGVSGHGNKFAAVVNNPFKNGVEFLGCYDDITEAHKVWRNRKHELACIYAEQQTDQRLAAALRNRFSA